MKTKMVNENLLDAETRSKMAGRVEVLDKVKKLFLLPQLNMMTVEHVADYYNVDRDAINSCYYRNKEEIDLDGVEKRIAKSFFERDFHFENHVKYRSHTDFQLSDGVILRVPNVGVRLFSKRAVLRIGMLLRDSVIAREVRTQLLNAFEKTDDGKNGDITAFCEAAMKYTSFKQRHINRLEAKINEDKPKVEFAETFGSGKDPVSVGTYAKLLCDRNGIDIGRNRLFVWMRDNGIVDGQNIPYQKYMNAGWFKVVSIQKPDVGRNIPTTRITAKGQQKLFELISKDYNHRGH